MIGLSSHWINPYIFHSKAPCEWGPTVILMLTIRIFIHNDRMLVKLDRFDDYICTRFDVIIPW